jgi:uncharacterized iron-regulated membrane protein
MKLKGLGNRAYNIFFHTHTVSGIVISALLYVIFLAGAFTIFRDEFYLWENPSLRHQTSTPINIEAILQSVKKAKPTFDIDDDITLQLPTQETYTIRLFGHLAAKGGQEQHFHVTINPFSGAIEDIPSSTIGETLYRLHFLDQIPIVGRYIAGLVALFFMFASITGLLIHWRNIFTKFWGFTLRGSLKQLWTNAHTVFGLLGFPFQLMYAVTGAFYMLTILVLLPAVMVLYGGDQEKVFAIVNPIQTISADKNSPKINHVDKINTTFSSTLASFKNYQPLYLTFKHLGRDDASMSFTMKDTDKTAFNSHAWLGYRLKNGENILKIIPNQNKTYAQSVVEGIHTLHFATYGGLVAKTVYFLMALFTCFVIISGILLWKEARKNKNYTPQQKHFHHRVTMYYLAICLSLLPAIAVLFCAELLVPANNHKFWVDSVFFGSWLILGTTGLLVAKEETKMTHWYLGIGGILALAVPLVNGMVTKQWFWVSFQQQAYSIFATDIFWLLLGLFMLTLAIPYFFKPLPNLKTPITPEKISEIL